MNEPCNLPPHSTPFSERALDALTFFLADVADGLGPFLTIYLTSRRGWSAGEAGLAMSVLLIGTVGSQALTGAWIDRTHRKRLAVSLAAVVVAGAALGLYYAPDRSVVFALQLLIGIVVTIFPPAIAAISLGLVGRDRLPARTGRNEACFHGGNVAAAGLAAAANWWLGDAGVFWGVAAMAIGSAVCAQLIREADIDHCRARGADSSSAKPQIAPLGQLLQNRGLLWFIAAIVLFHFGNAAMLPLMGQKVAQHSPEHAPTLMAVCIIVAQIAMIPVALLASRWAVVSRRSVFLIGFAVLPIRGWLYTMTDDSRWLIANQILDGIGAGIFGVVAVLMIADLTRGTGRFNLAQGITATAVGLGAAASNFLTGQLVDHWGYNAGFLFLSAVAAAALAVFYCAVPDTVALTSQVPLGPTAITASRPGG